MDKFKAEADRYISRNGEPLIFMQQNMGPEECAVWVRRLADLLNAAQAYHVANNPRRYDAAGVNAQSQSRETLLDVARKEWW